MKGLKKSQKRYWRIYIRTAYGFLTTNYTFYPLPYLCTISLLICHLSLKHRMNMHSQELEDKAKQTNTTASSIHSYLCLYKS